MNPMLTRKVIAAGTIGNVLEWYDFAIYGYFASAIGRHFFPREDPVAQLLAAFGVFAIGYLMRPIGGALIGHIGDRFGRRTSLTVSVAAMAIPTFLIGLLPGYETIGRLAPVALLLLRSIRWHSAGLGSRSDLRRNDVDPDARSVGLAHSIPPWTPRRRRGFLSAPAHRRSGRGARRSQPDRRDLALSLAARGAACCAVGVQRGQLLCDVRLCRELAADRRWNFAGARPRDQLHQHGDPAARAARHADGVDLEG